MAVGEIFGLRTLLKKFRRSSLIQMTSQTNRYRNMPFIRVDWFPGRTLEQKRELAEVLTREFARISKCKPETINFIFTDVSREDWGRNGKLFCDSYEYENDKEI